MNTRSISRICGVLYVTTVLASMAGNLLLKERLVDYENVPGTLRLVAANALQFRLAVAVDFVAMVAVMALAVCLLAMLKHVSPFMALLALGWRIGEVVLQAGARIPDYLLLTLSRTVGSSSAMVTAEVEHLGQLLLAGSTQALWLSFVFSSAGSLLNNFLIYKSRAIPVVVAAY
jgi:hypothetical protein